MDIYLVLIDMKVRNMGLIIDDTRKRLILNSNHHKEEGMMFFEPLAIKYILMFEITCPL